MRDRSAIDPIRANTEIHELVRDGVKVEVRGPEGARITETVRVIDWNDPKANDFFLASQVWFAGELYTKRAPTSSASSTVCRCSSSSSRRAIGDGRRI